MNKFSGWLRRFFAGRYGHDKLNMVLLGTGLVVSIISMFVRNKTVAGILVLLSYILLGLSLFRCLSRDTYKRYQENRRYLLLVDRLKDRNNRYYSCPKCRQTVRVPKGKGKIAITCPKCRERFIKKT